MIFLRGSLLCDIIPKKKNFREAGVFMRLFHVSEQANIGEFVPRCPARGDLDPAVALVWAIDEARLPNYLTPRDCPRVTYHVGEHTTQSDREMFFT